MPHAAPFRDMIESYCQNLKHKGRHLRCGELRLRHGGDGLEPREHGLVLGHHRLLLLRRQLQDVLRENETQVEAFTRQAGWLESDIRQPFCRQGVPAAVPRSR